MYDISTLGTHIVSYGLLKLATLPTGFESPRANRVVTSPFCKT